jgi:hypothetical protein
MTISGEFVVNTAMKSPFDTPSLLKKVANRLISKIILASVQLNQVNSALTILQLPICPIPPLKPQRLIILIRLFKNTIKRTGITQTL